MSGPEIRDIIKANNELIENRPHGVFTLDHEVLEAMCENTRLRRECPHEYDENHRCIYCDLEEGL